MDKGDMVPNGILLSHEKEQNNAICSNVDREVIILIKISQSEKDKYHMISCGI